MKRYGMALTIRALFFYLRQRLADRIRLIRHSQLRVLKSNELGGKREDNSRVLFVTFSYESGSTRYRVNNIAEYLERAGYYSDILHGEDLKRVREYALSFDIIVISHLALDPVIQKFINDAKALGRILVYGMDDPLFLSDVLRTYFRLPPEFGDSEKNFYYHEADRRLALMKQCDCFLASTEYLARQAENVGLSAYVIRNGLSRAMVDAGMNALAKKSKLQANHGGKTIIGYFSGTRTHDFDFTLVTEALLSTLEQFSFVEMRIYGYLDLDVRFLRFKHQVKRRPLTSWQRIISEIASVDINIAPLELKSELTEAKSEIKYIEAALVKVPTVASATDTFTRVITHGVTGYLAQNHNDWYEHLKCLILNPAERSRIADAAHRHVVSDYSPATMSKQTAAVIHTIAQNHACSFKA